MIVWPLQAVAYPCSRVKPVRFLSLSCYLKVVAALLLTFFEVNSRSLLDIIRAQIFPLRMEKMPFYEYQCEACGHRLEALQKMSDDPLVYCPECNEAQLKKLILPPLFI